MKKEPTTWLEAREALDEIEAALEAWDYEKGTVTENTRAREKLQNTAATLKARLPHFEKRETLERKGEIKKEIAALRAERNKVEARISDEREKARSTVQALFAHPENGGRVQSVDDYIEGLLGRLAPVLTLKEEAARLNAKINAREREAMECASGEWHWKYVISKYREKKKRAARPFEPHTVESGTGNMVAEYEYGE